MKKYVSLLCSVMCLLLPIHSMAQDMPEIVPPSPEAAALGNFVDVPISHYTGLPNISVPIYTISQDGVTIPIQLSYHARGVKVAEVAPRTGMGWSLQYGGSITRQVRGRSDEYGANGYLNNSNAFINFSSSLSTRVSVRGIETNDPGYDFFPDLFTFSAGNISGKFILDYTTGQPIIQSNEDITITFTEDDTANAATPGGISTFVITDSQGTKYYFGKSKYGSRYGQDYQDSGGFSVFNSGSQNGGVIPDGPDDTGDRSISSWKLMDIETVNGELISYYYEGEEGYNSASTYFRKSFDKHLPPPGSNVINTAAGMSNLNAIYSKLSKVWNYEKQLTKITFNQGRDSIVFTKSPDWRLDFEGYSLDKISVYHSDQLIKSYNLNYTYTTSTDTSNLLWFFADPNNANFSRTFSRMFLSSVQEEGPNGTTKPPYTFTYDPTVLPSTNSSRQDYWGYYNGAPNNGPFTRMFEYGTYTPDRRVNIELSEAGLLKEIEYPTGGKTLLTYEHNIGAVPEDFNSVIIPSVNPGSQDEVEIVLNKSDFFDAQGNAITPQINIPNGTLVSTTFNCLHFQSVENENSNDPLPDCLFYFSINGSPVNYGNDSQYDLGEEIFVYISANGNHTSLALNAFPLSGINPPNLYMDPQYDFEVVIKYDTPDLRDNLYGPGKRIKKIENIDLLGNSVIKEYEYAYGIVDPTNGQTVYKNSGAIVGLPSYLNTSIGYPPYYIKVITDYNDAGAMFGTFQANTIGYSGVIEYYGTKYNNVGKTEYIFSNISDSGGDYFKFPYHPPTDNEWLRGKNIRTKYYKNDNNTYKLVKEVYNKYLYGNNEYTGDLQYAGLLNENFVFTPAAEYYDWEQNSQEPGYIPSVQSAGYLKDRTLSRVPLFMNQRVPVGDPNFDIVTDNPGYRVYHFIGGTQHLLRSTETLYDDNENVTLVTETETGFNYDKHYQQASVTSVTSDGKAVSQTFTYPQDKSNPTAIEQALIDQNRVVPLETNSFKDINNNGNFEGSERLSSTKTVYAWDYNNSGNSDDVLKPSFVETSKGDNALENRIEFKDYDDKGNILWVKRTNGMDVCYIYGYDQTLPVAKIENATYTQVSGYVTNIQNKSNLDDDHCMDSGSCDEKNLRTALNSLRNGLPNAMVTTYTYDPLIGVTSMTDPKGYTVYYEYDELNRLKRVKNQNGKVMSENKYHYLLDN